MPDRDTVLKVAHVYEHDAQRFEELVNQALADILDKGGLIGNIEYASDPATAENRKGGFGALILYELPTE